MRRPVRTSLALFRSPWYTLGIVVAMAGWGLHVGALALAPISLVQSVIAGGLVLLTVTADRLFAHQVTRREWIGVGLAALGLAFLAATLEGTGDEAHADYETARLVTYVAIVSAAAIAVAVAAIRKIREGVMLGVSAGLFWAASDTTIKALSGELGDSAWTAILFSPGAVVIGDRALLGRRPGGLRPQPADRQGGAGDRAHQRRRERAHDRRRPTGLRGAVPRLPARRHPAAGGVRARDRRRGAHPRSGERRREAGGGRPR
jgi:hypothetical protein